MDVCIAANCANLTLGMGWMAWLLCIPGFGGRPFSRRLSWARPAEVAALSQGAASNFADDFLPSAAVT